MACVAAAASSHIVGTSCSFAQNVVLTTSSYSQNFDSLAQSGSTNSSGVPTGWQFSETGSGANNTYAAGTGSDTAGNTYSFGPSANFERAFGGLQSGAVVPTIGAGFTFNSPGTLTSFSISYTGEQWRLGATGRVDRLDFQYSTDATSIITGTWTDADALDFTAPVTAGTVGPLVGNNSPNKTAISASVTGLSISGGATFYVRWNDFNPTGSDDGLGIDDLTFNFTTAERFWNTTSGTWNTTTPNWRNGSTAGVNYVSGDKVYFGQTSGDSVVTIPTNVSPQSITVNATHNYTFTGAGAIVTSAGLNKVGTGQLIIENDNQISGDSNIVGGLQLGNGGTTGSLGSGNIILNQGILSFQRSNALAINGNITGAGAVFNPGADRPRYPGRTRTTVRRL